MVLTLTFKQDGSIGGQGIDDLSQYKISGSTQPDGTFRFDKKYCGRVHTHTVIYSGSVKWQPTGRPELRGKWSIPPMEGEGFLLTPNRE